MPHDPTPLSVGGVSLRLYPHDMPAQAQLDELRHQATLGAQAGFDGVMVAEHHADFPGYFPNPIQLSQLLIAVMPRGWVAPCPLLLPIQPYSLTVEQLAWLSTAYPGRIGAGFAAGALPIDFELAEVPFDEIRDRFKAALPRVVAALRGHDDGPIGRDRAVIRCREHPLPMVVAAQSGPAVRRAAALGIGVLYDSQQLPEVSERLGRSFDEAGGTGAKILIRRVWIGDPPTEAMAAQLAQYRTYTSTKALESWGSVDQLVYGATGAEAAEKLVEVVRASRCDTVNIRVHLKGIQAEQVRDQIVRQGDELVPLVRRALAV